MKKKADINWQIISLVLALMVFIILLFVFRTSIFKTTNTSQVITSCESLGKDGKCKSSCDSNEFKIETGCPKGQYCCIPKGT